MDAVTSAGVLVAVVPGVDAVVNAGGGTDDEIAKADVTRRGMAAPKAEGAPEGCTPASGPGRGVWTGGGWGLIEAGIDAAVGADANAIDAGSGTDEGIDEEDVT